MFSESDFKRFREEVLKRAEEKGREIFEEATKRAEELKAEAERRGREVYSEELRKKKRELFELFSEKRRRLIEEMDAEKERLIAEKVSEVEREVLKRENFSEILSCFIRRAESEVGRGELTVNPEILRLIPEGISFKESESVDLLEFEGEERVFTLTRKELRREILNLIEEELLGKG